MKRKINRIMIISLVIGFCICPSVLKSQMVQPSHIVSSILGSEMKQVTSFINWFSIEDISEPCLDQEKMMPFKSDSLKRKKQCTHKPKIIRDTIPTKIKTNAHRKIKKSNYRNKPVIIQTRI